MSTDQPIPQRRAHDRTQQYGEPDEAYRDRIETKVLGRRVERAESVRVMAVVSASEVLGL